MMRHVYMSFNCGCGPTKQLEQIKVWLWPGLAAPTTTEKICQFGAFGRILS